MPALQNTLSDDKLLFQMTLKFFKLLFQMTLLKLMTPRDLRLPECAYVCQGWVRGKILGLAPFPSLVPRARR